MIKAWFIVYACVFTIYASHHFAPCRSMTRGAAQHRSHQVASVRSDRGVLYLLRKTARLRCSSLAFASKIGSFRCFRPKRTVENFSPNQWVLLSFIFFLFLHFFRCFSGENGSFVLQIVQFSRTWCSNHFVSYFEIQILHVSKFFNDFRGNRNLQKMRKKKKRKEKKHKQSNGQKTKNQCDLPFCTPAPFCVLPYWYTYVL